MEHEVKRGWRQLANCKGTFSGYFVEGFKYRDESGESGWHTCSYRSNPISNPVHEFWVSGETFRDFEMEPPDESLNLNANIGGVAENLDRAETEAVLEAIRAWEEELRAT